MFHFIGGTAAAIFLHEIISGEKTQAGMDPTKGIKTRKTDPLPGTSHSEPDKLRRTHYAGRTRPRPQPAPAQPAPAQPEEPSITFQGEKYTYPSPPAPQPAPQQRAQEPATGTGTEQTDTGAHTGSAGSHSDQPHTYAPRAPTSASIDLKTASQQWDPNTFASRGRPVKATVGDLIARDVVEKLKKEKLSGLPEISSSNEKLVRLARASYINQQNKYNTVF